MSAPRVQVRPITGHNLITLSGYVVVCDTCPDTFVSGPRGLAEDHARSHRRHHRREASK